MLEALLWCKIDVIVSCFFLCFSSVKRMYVRRRAPRHSLQSDLAAITHTSEDTSLGMITESSKLSKVIFSIYNQIIIRIPRQEYNFHSSAVNVTDTSYINKVIFPSQMIVEIRSEQTLRGTRPNKRLSLMNCAICAFCELALRCLFCFGFSIPISPSIVIHLRRGNLEYERCRRVQRAAHEI